MNKEALRRFARPAVPFTVGMMAFLGSFVDIGITDHNASKDANKVFPPKASGEELAEAKKQIVIFDQRVIEKAHRGATNIDTSQIPRQSEAIQALNLIKQEAEISQERKNLRRSLASKSRNRYSSLMVTGFGLILLGILWQWKGLQKPRRNGNTVSAEPTAS